MRWIRLAGALVVLFATAWILYPSRAQTQPSAKALEAVLLARQAASDRD